MPLYDFKCKSCGYKFEKLVFKEEEIKEIKCPKCQSNNIEKLLTTFRIGSSENSESSCPTCPTCSSGTCSL